jgi:hypothetical protein
LLLISNISQTLWAAVSDRFFGPSNPGRYFKRLAKFLTLRGKVLKSISSQAEAVHKPGSHSSSLEPNDYENVFVVEKLAIKLFQECQSFLDRVESEKAEAAAQLQKKKDISNFLVPPPPGLGTCNVLSILSSTTITSSIVSPHPTATKRAPNNQQGALDASFNFDEEEEKENSSACRAVKWKKQPVLAGVDARTLLYSAMGQKDPTVDMFSFLLVEFQRSEAAAEERRKKNEAAAELRHWKAEAAAEELRKEEADRKMKLEEHAQHMKLLEMLHDGKISKEKYEVMKPSGF